MVEIVNGSALDNSIGMFEMSTIKKRIFPRGFLIFRVKMDKAVGVFQHEKSEGMDEYLTAMGVPWMVR